VVKQYRSELYKRPPKKGEAFVRQVALVINRGHEETAATSAPMTLTTTPPCRVQTYGVGELL
jgi:hypothetical protein